MTITAEQNLVEYTGNGVTTVFAAPWRYLDADDLKVIKRTIATGVDALQTRISDYTVSGVGDATGGNVTFLVAPVATEKVVIYGDPPLKQETDYTTADSFPAASHETALDVLTNQEKATRSRVERAIRIPFGDGILDTELGSAIARASKFLSFDAAGVPILAAGTSEHWGVLRIWLRSLAQRRYESNHRHPQGPRVGRGRGPRGEGSDSA